jgi:hypothetical protein
MLMDAMILAKATGRLVVALSIFLLRGVRRLFLCLLLGFELLFIFRSLIDLLSGGVGKMLAWWWHLQKDGSSMGQLFAPFNLWKFLFDQLVVLAVLGTLWFFEWRYPRRLSRSVTPA